MKHSDKEKEFTILIESNQGIIHKVCHAYTQDAMAHDDLFQEIVLQCWKSYDSFKGDSKFSTWMYRVGINTAITLYRKRKNHKETASISDYHFKIKAEEKDEHLNYQLMMLKKAIQKLDDIEKALVMLYLDEIPYKEISETMGISEVNARVKMNRIKKKLKELLQPYM